MSQPLKILKFEPKEQKIKHDDNYSREIDKNDVVPSILLPLKVAAIITAIAGVLALVFEVKAYISYSFEIYLARLFLTVIAFVSLVLSQTQFGKKHSTGLLHFYLGGVIVSFGLVVYKLPEHFLLNGLIVIFLIFTLSLFLGWKSVNQIMVLSLFYLVFGLVVYLADIDLTNSVNLPVLLTVVFLSVLSVFINKLTYKNKLKLIDNFNSMVRELNDLDDDDVSQIQQGTKSVNIFEDNDALGFFKVDKNGKLKYVNKGFIELLKYNDKNELLKKKFDKDIFSSPAEFSDLINRAKNNGFGKLRKTKLKTKTGKDITVFLTIQKSFEEKNDVFTGMFLDISLYEKEIEKLNNELKRLKKEVNNASLTATTAEYASNVKTQFLANMSHEIRTPMNSVLGFLTLIENGLFESEKELKDFARNAKTSAESLLDIINNILDLSKIEAGKMDVDVMELSVVEEINKAVSIVTPLLNDKKLDLKIDVSPEIPEVLYGDATKYRQVVVNLLNNAVKFTDTGFVEINVGIDTQTEAIIKIRTSVIDTGKGIPEEKIPLLFKPFQQLQNSLQKEGTGLGLMICREFVKLMGGEINVESEVGKGTKFTFTVVFSLYEKFDPAELGAENDVEDEPEPPEVETEDSVKEVYTDHEEPALVESMFEGDFIPLAKPVKTGGKRKHLLLVEDNPISQKVELKLLRDAGYEVEAVTNGYDAIEAIKSGKFDLVLMDIEMKDMDGLEATKRIRSLTPPVNNVPIIAVTAHSSMKDREKCLAAGMNDYIAKPININFLKMTIDQWLNDD